MRHRRFARWWRKTEPLYRRFSAHAGGRDAREAYAMFEAETFGGVQPTVIENRYASGKMMMEVNASMWRRDISQGLLMKFELNEDKSFGGVVRPWVDRVLLTVVGAPNAMLEAV